MAGRFDEQDWSDLFPCWMTTPTSILIKRGLVFDDDSQKRDTAADDTTNQWLTLDEWLKNMTKAELWWKRSGTWDDDENDFGAWLEIVQEVDEALVSCIEKLHRLGWECTALNEKDILVSGWAQIFGSSSPGPLGVSVKVSLRCIQKASLCVKSDIIPTMDLMTFVHRLADPIFFGACRRPTGLTSLP